MYCWDPIDVISNDNEECVLHTNRLKENIEFYIEYHGFKRKVFHTYIANIDCEKPSTYSGERLVVILNLTSLYIWSFYAKGSIFSKNSISTDFYETR